MCFVYLHPSNPFPPLFFLVIYCKRLGLLRLGVSIHNNNNNNNNKRRKTLGVTGISRQQRERSSAQFVTATAVNRVHHAVFDGYPKPSLLKQHFLSRGVAAFGLECYRCRSREGIRHVCLQASLSWPVS